MLVSLVLCLVTLVLLVATAASGVAIAVLERRGVVPRLAESAFLGLAGAGSAILVASVLLMHPVTAEGVARLSHALAVAGDAMAAEYDPTATIPAADRPDDVPCVSLAELPAYDRHQARFDGQGAKGESGHEVPVFRSPGSR